MTPELHIDLETKSDIDLRKRGVYVYAESPHTDVLCAAYAFGDEPVSLWTPYKVPQCPSRIAGHILNGGTIVAHNAAFERVLWWSKLTPKYGWPKPRIEQFRCTMVQAMAMSLPGGLDDAAAAVGLTIGKDQPGYRLMLQMSKPRSWNGTTPVWWDGAERFQKLYDYCKNDVEVERQLDKRLVPLSQSERELWILDQRINDRGIQADVKLCTQAAKIVDAATAKLDREMSEATEGEVTGVNQVARLLIWLRAKGVDCDSVAKDALTDLLALDTLPPECRRALEIRKEGAKASTAKIDALLNGANRDGRSRGLLQFHGANTGRWAGRRFQPQNLPRPAMEDQEDIENAVAALMTGDLGVVEMVYDRPLSVVADCLRSMVRAGA